MTGVSSKSGGVVRRVGLLVTVLALASLNPVGSPAASAAPGDLTFVEVHRDEDGALDGVGGVGWIALSPDANHVYVAAEAEDEVGVFARDPATGTLTSVEVVRSAAGVGGLPAGGESVVVSPDGSHVYVAGGTEDTITVFTRTAATGVLGVVASVVDGVDGVDGLDGVAALVLSPDGSHLYAAAAIEKAIAVFARDPASGGLSLVDVVRDGVAGVQGLNWVRALAVSPDGSHVYSSGLGDAVAAFARDAATGALSFIAVEHDGVAGVDGLSQPGEMAISPDGKYLYVPGAGDDAVATFERHLTTGELTYRGLIGDHMAGVDGLDGAAAVRISPDGAHVYVAAITDASVAVFNRNAVTGALTFGEVHKDGVSGVAGLGKASILAASGDGAHLYAAGLHGNAVAAFDRDGGTGGLTYLQAYVNGSGGIEGLRTPDQVAVSGDGADVYVTGTADDAIAHFSHTPADGTLTFRAAYLDGADGIDGLDGARALALSPDGEHLYAAGSNDLAIAAFARNVSTGALSFVATTQDGVAGPGGVVDVQSAAVSPDGRHVYAAGSLGNGLAAYARDPGTGLLTLVEVQRDGTSGVDGLAGARSVTVTPDGSHVYVAGYFDDAVAAFSRDVGTGALTYLEMYADGAGGVDGLWRVTYVTVSPDGEHLYAAGLNDDAVAVFRRDPATGSLHFVEAEQDGVGGTVGLDSVRALAVAPDGRHVYTVSPIANAVSVFTRNPATGELAFASTLGDGIGGVDGLEGANHIALSPDGRTTYVLGSFEHAIAVFARAGRADTVGLVDPNQGRWHLRDSAGQTTTFYYGNPGDIPFMGDWDCNGVETPGLFRQSDAFAYLRNSNTVGIADIRFFFGNPSDIPLAGDWNGDGCDTVSIYRPDEQRFYIINTLGQNEGGLGAADFSFLLGNPGDKPVVGDWDGDGIDEVGLHRESTGLFYWRNTLDTGIADGEIFFGDPADRVVAGDWGVVDGSDTPAVFRPFNTTMFFRHTLTQGVADSQFVFGESAWLPVAGTFGLG